MRSGFVSIGTVEGTYSDFDRNCSTTSCNFGVNLQLQFLDNLVKESNHMWTWKQTQSQGEGMDYDWHEMYNEYSFVAVGELNAWTRLVVALVLEKTRSFTSNRSTLKQAPARWPQAGTSSPAGGTGRWSATPSTAATL